MHGLCPGCIAHEEVARKNQNIVVTDNVPAPPIAPAPQWSTTPPADPGFWWARDKYETFVVWLDDGGTWWCMATSETFVINDTVEFWPVRIEPPR
jgi:hypothetical protein